MSKASKNSSNDLIYKGKNLKNSSIQIVNIGYDTIKITQTEELNNNISELLYYYHIHVQNLHYYKISFEKITFTSLNFDMFNENLTLREISFFECRNIEKINLNNLKKVLLISIYNSFNHFDACFFQGSLRGIKGKFNHLSFNGEKINDVKKIKAFKKSSYEKWLKQKSQSVQDKVEEDFENVFDFFS